MTLKIANLRLQLHLSGANGLTTQVLMVVYVYVQAQKTRVLLGG